MDRITETYIYKKEMGKVHFYNNRCVADAAKRERTVVKG